MKTMVVKLYKFEELSDKAKKTAIENHRSKISGSHDKINRGTRNYLNNVNEEIVGIADIMEVKRNKIAAFPETEMTVTEKFMNNKYFHDYFKDIVGETDGKIRVSYNGMEVIVKAVTENDPISTQESFIEGYIHSIINNVNDSIKRYSKYLSSDDHINYMLEYDKDRPERWFHADGSDAHEIELELLKFTENKI